MKREMRPEPAWQAVRAHLGSSWYLGLLLRHGQSSAHPSGCCYTKRRAGLVISDNRGPPETSSAWKCQARPPGASLLVLLPLHSPLCSPQIAPQIQQMLHFNELAPTHPPDLMKHKVLEQQGRLLHLETHTFQKDLDPDRETAPSTMASTPTASSTYTLLSP